MNLRAKKSKTRAAIGTNARVMLGGEKRRIFRRSTTITWTKDGERWNPRASGARPKAYGFTFRRFNADDAGVYVATVIINKKNRLYKCSVTVNMEVL